jgi:hypothetical protein
MISAADLARRLARNAEAVCRHYLSNGRRSGRYWSVGDVLNTAGRSLYVRLHGPDYGPGAAGKWTDAATGEHGDLLDLIARNRHLLNLTDAIDEACRFLSLPRATPLPSDLRGRAPPRSGSPEAARRLFRSGRPIAGTLAESYLRARGIEGPLDWPSLRFHPSAYYRATSGAPLEQWPALLATVTDLRGTITGIQRTWLDRKRPLKAPIANPRRAMGHLLGNGVRFGTVSDILAAGEGIETMLAIKSVLPLLPVIAGLSANHLAALDLPPDLARLYVARDNDVAGHQAVRRLRERFAALDIRELVPVHDDFNADLSQLGADALRARILDQFVAVDALRFGPASPEPFVMRSASPSGVAPE